MFGDNKKVGQVLVCVCVCGVCVDGGGVCLVFMF